MVKKIIAWILGKGKIGRTIKTVQASLDGKKQLLASLAAAIGGSVTIISKFAEAGDDGIKYLLNVASTPEFATASMGWIGLFNAIKGEKIRKENAEILAKQK